MVMAENQYGNIAPKNIDPKTHPSITSTFPNLFSVAALALVIKAPYKLKLTRAADPMAKPFPTAAVVLPAASKASVTSLTSG